MKKFVNKFSVLAVAISVTLLAILSVSNNHSLPKGGVAEQLNFDIKKSRVGAYLAGQHAARKSDFSRASRYFLESIDLKQTSAKGEHKSEIIDEQVLDLLIATGKYDDAISLAKKINPNAETASAGLLLYAKNIKDADYKAAVALLDSQSDEAKETVIHNILRSWALLGDGKNDEALKAFEKLNKTGYFKTLIGFNQALIAEIAGDDLTAARLYKSLLNKRSPQNTSKKIAENAYRFFKKTGDEAAFEAILAAKNEHVKWNDTQSPPTIQEGIADAFNEVATMLIGEQNFGKSSVFFRLGLLVEPSNEEAVILLGTILSHEKDYVSANQIFAKIPDNSDLAQEAKIARAQNYVAMENLVAAKKLLKTLAEHEDTKIEAYMTLGDLSRQDEDFSAANENYSKAIDASIDKEVQQIFWPLYFARGVTFERLKKWDDAEADFKKALELEPDQPDVLNYLAYSLLDMNKEDRFDEALDMLELAYKQRPNDAHIVDSIGWAWFKKGDYQKAVKHLEVAASDMPYDPTINEHLGDVYWKVGRKLEAKFAWQRALANEPEERFLAELKNKVENGLENDGNELENQDSSTR